MKQEKWWKTDLVQEVDETKHFTGGKRKDNRKLVFQESYYWKERQKEQERIK